MHILHVHDRLSTKGGADLHLLGIARHQARTHRVTLLGGHADSSRWAPPGVEAALIGGLGGRARRARRALRRLEVWVDARRPELIHLHNVLQPELMTWVAARGPSMATVQDHRSFCPGRGRMLPDGHPCSVPPGSRACAACFDDPEYAAMILDLTARRAEALRGFSRVVVLSHYMAQELTAAGVESGRIRVIPPFAWSPEPPAEPPGPLPRAPMALAAGRMVHAKGFHKLLEAWARLRPSMPLLLVGDGPALDDLRAQAEALALEEVAFLGWRPRAEVEALLGRAQLAVMPSLWAEPFGIAGLEAQARGVPVVAFDVGGVGDWLKPEHGWLVEPNDVEALAGALAEACEPDEARRRGSLAQAFTAERFDAEGLMERLERVYGEVLSESGREGIDPSPTEG